MGQEEDHWTLALLFYGVALITFLSVASSSSPFLFEPSIFEQHYGIGQPFLSNVLQEFSQVRNQSEEKMDTLLKRAYTNTTKNSDWKQILTKELGKQGQLKVPKGYVLYRTTPEQIRKLVGEAILVLFTAFKFKLPAKIAVSIAPSYQQIVHRMGLAVDEKGRVIFCPPEIPQELPIPQENETEADVIEEGSRNHANENQEIGLAEAGEVDSDEEESSGSG